MFEGFRVSIWEEEKILEMDGGDGYTTHLNVLKVTDLYTYKWL
jgi:hypothetical protein